MNYARQAIDDSLVLLNDILNDYGHQDSITLSTERIIEIRDILKKSEE